MNQELGTTKVLRTFTDLDAWKEGHVLIPNSLFKICSNYTMIN